MTVNTGTQLGSYEILAPIAAGGMGEVYWAHDTKLVSWSRDGRFILYACHFVMNHPHICTLHDVSRENGTAYLVMEFLEGATLAERLNKGALPIEQVLRYAIEIADALDKAHQAGITHRDLKPGNIMLTKAGAKLVDVGLATLRPISAPVCMLRADCV